MRFSWKLKLGKKLSCEVSKLSYLEYNQKKFHTYNNIFLILKN